MPDSAQRLNYHTGLFLEATDFTLEQDYHSLLRRRLNYGLLGPGILNGLDLEYDGGQSVIVKTGIAVDNDPFTQLAREIVVTSEYTYALTGSRGETVYIVLSYTTRNGPAKSTSTSPATIYEVASITEEPDNFTQAPNFKIILGKITIKTPLVGTAPERQMAQVRSDILPAGGPSVIPAILAVPASVPAGTTAVITVIATGGFDLTGVIATDVSISGLGITNVAIVPNSNVGTMLQMSFDITSSADLVARTLTITKGAFIVSTSFYITPGLTLTGYAGVNVPDGITYIKLMGTGFSAPAMVEFSRAGGGFSAPLMLFGNITPTEIRVDMTSTPFALDPITPDPVIPGPVRVTVPIFGTITSVFAFVPPAVITSISPTAQSRGSYITITGAGFFNTPTVPTILFSPYNQATAVRGPNSTPPFPSGSYVQAETWSENALYVRIPSGVSTGSSIVRVVTGAESPASGTPIPQEGEIVQWDTPITIT